MVVFAFERPEAVGRIFRFRNDASKAAGSEKWRNFCRHGTNFMRNGRGRGTIFIGLQICPGAGSWSKPPGAVSRYKHWRKKEFVTVQKLLSGQRSVSRLYEHLNLNSVQEPPSKNCDKKITTTVRVSRRRLFCFYE